jgi:hypothetical protein
MRLVVIGMVVVLAGCAGPTIYDKHGVSAEIQQKEFAECNFEALKATGSAPGGSIVGYGASNTIANDIQTGIRRNEIMHACLISKGFYVRSQ